MARKTLLTEAQITKFMKLANLPGLSEEKLEEMGYTAAPVPGNRDEELYEEEEEEDELERELRATEDELGDEDHVADEEADELDVDDLDMDVDMDAAAADVDGEELVMSLLAKVEDWATEHGVEMDVEGGAEEGGEELEVDAEVDVEEIPMDDVDMEMGDEEVAAIEDEEEIMMMEAAKRVIEQIMSEKTKSTLDKDTLAEQITNRIFARLAQKK